MLPAGVATLSRERSCYVMIKVIYAIGRHLGQAGVAQVKATWAIGMSAVHATPPQNAVQSTKFASHAVYAHKIRYSF